MGMLDRFTDIIKANINDLLDKAEDPAKMIDQYLRDLTEILAEVKRETAGVMAEEARTKRLVDDNAAEAAKYDELARKALSAGSEDDARTFLAKKQQLEAKAAGLQATYDAAHENAANELNQQPVDDAAALEAKYAAAGTDAAVDDELAKLKKEMGL